MACFQYSVYDPLGFLAPLTPPVKLLLQEFCRKKYDWDDPIPQAFQQKWKNWLADLEKTVDFKVKGVWKDDKSQLHHFSNASESGYRMATDIRLQNIFQK